MQKGIEFRLVSCLLFAGLAICGQTAYADLTFQAYNNGGGKTRLDVVSASGVAVDSDNNAYF